MIMENGNNQAITIVLPDGRQLIAKDKGDNDYPGISIELVNADGSQNLIAWAEYNTACDSASPEQRLRQILWNSENDEPAVIMEYDTGVLVEER